MSSYDTITCGRLAPGRQQLGSGGSLCLNCWCQVTLPDPPGAGDSAPDTHQQPSEVFCPLISGPDWGPMTSPAAGVPTGPSAPAEGGGGGADEEENMRGGGKKEMKISLVTVGVISWWCKFFLFLFSLLVTLLSLTSIPSAHCFSLLSFLPPPYYAFLSCQLIFCSSPLPLRLSITSPTPSHPRSNTHYQEVTVIELSITCLLPR